MPIVSGKPLWGCIMNKLPQHIERAITAFGYANRHPEDAGGIDRAYRHLVASIVELQVSVATPEVKRIAWEATIDNLGPAAAVLSLLEDGDGFKAFQNLDEGVQLALFHGLALQASTANQALECLAGIGGSDEAGESHE